jgi:hypothetical protein
MLFASHIDLEPKYGSLVCGGTRTCLNKLEPAGYTNSIASMFLYYDEVMKAIQSGWGGKKL